MNHIYHTKDTCPSEIKFDIENDIVRNVEFNGGCNGNLKAIPILIEGWHISDVVEKLQGIKCGRRPTSCADQLAAALLVAAEKSK